MLITRLHNLLDEIRITGGDTFAGIGVLVSNAPDDLPIMPLRATLDRTRDVDTKSLLTDISQIAHEYHDGFHVISSEFRVLKLSVYFSPPIVREVIAGPQHDKGARYWAALYGSALPAVVMAGVASPRYGVVVFEAGREVHI